MSLILCDNDCKIEFFVTVSTIFFIAENLTLGLGIVIMLKCT